MAKYIEVISLTNFKSSNGFVQLKDIFFAINEHNKNPNQNILIIIVNPKKKELPV